MATKSLDEQVDYLRGLLGKIKDGELDKRWGYSEFDTRVSIFRVQCSSLLAKSQKEGYSTRIDALVSELHKYQEEHSNLMRELARAKESLESRFVLMPEIPGNSEEQRYEDGPFKGPWPRKPKPDGYNN